VDQIFSHKITPQEKYIKYRIYSNNSPGELLFQPMADPGELFVGELFVGGI